MPVQKAKPFVKWAGGKSQLLPQIREKYPAELGTSINKYAEPLVGGGAVLFDILNNYKMDAVYISDINRELIACYQTIRDDVAALIERLSAMQRVYWQSDLKERQRIYNDNRTRFNDLKSGRYGGVEVAALFIFLNRTCFNGLYRVNAKGAFNVPIGRYSQPLICDEKNLTSVSKKLQGVDIVCGDYRLSRLFIDSRTLAYFDPPYRPLNETSSFTSYTKEGFGDTAQAELARFIDELAERGAHVIASNSDPKNSDTNDDFFDVLYQKHQITRVHASRSINSAKSGRGKISELLIANR